jgi:hypothetical protein
MGGVVVDDELERHIGLDVTQEGARQVFVNSVGPQNCE